MTDTEKFDKIVSKMADILYAYDEKERKEMLEGAILEAWKPELKDNQLQELTEGFSRLVTERLDGNDTITAWLGKDSFGKLRLYHSEECWGSGLRIDDEDIKKKYADMKAEDDPIKVELKIKVV